jgi:hypothetical protein
MSTVSVVCNRIVGDALQLGRVLEDDDAMVRRGSDHLGDDRVGECRLAGAGAARDNDVHPRRHSVADHARLRLRHDPVAHIGRERDHLRGAPADCKSRSGHDWGQQSLKAVRADRQFAGHDRTFVIDLGVEGMRDTTDDDLGRGVAHMTNARDPLP